MKNVRLLLIVTMFVVGCKNTDHGTVIPVVVAKPGVITALLDNSEWTSTSASAEFVDGALRIKGVDKNVFDLDIFVKGSLAEGDYNVLGFNDNSVEPIGIVYYNGAESYRFSPDGTAGSVTISEIDSVNMTITGKFTSTLGWTITHPVLFTFTNGVFTKIPYTKPKQVAAGDYGSFTGKVDNIAITDLSGVESNLTDTGLGMKFYSPEQYHYFYIKLSPDVTTGTFNLGTPVDDYYAEYSEYGLLFASTDGTVTITSLDLISKHIEGTITFNSLMTFNNLLAHSVTEGKFAATGW